MAEPPWPPPDDPRPFDWARDAPEWGEEGITEDRLTLLILLAAFACLAIGMTMLYVWFL